MQKKIKSYYQVIINKAPGIFSKGIVCFVAFYVWYFVLGSFYPIAGTVIGILSAIAVLFFMLMFEVDKSYNTALSNEEIRNTNNDIIWQATFKAGKRLAKAYTTCNLTRAIDSEFIHPTTGDKYRLIFRRARNGERVQASHMRKPVQAAKEASESIYIETDEDWPGPFKPAKEIEDKAGSIETPEAKQGVHEIAYSVFGSA